MKPLIISVLIFASTFFAFSSGPNASPALKIGEYVELPSCEKSAAGFLQYIGEHEGITFCALSSDIGSALPSQDFRLYVKMGDTYRIVFSLPLLNQKGFRCTCEQDTLKVYLTKRYDETRKGIMEKNPVLTINLSQLAEVYRSWLTEYYGKTLSSFGKIVSIQTGPNSSVNPASLKWTHPDLWELIEHSKVQDYHSTSVAVGIPPSFSIQYAGGLRVHGDRYIATITLPDGRKGKVVLLPKSPTAKD